MYTGECQKKKIWKIKDRKPKPKGRGFLACADKWIIGTVKDGEWDLNSHKMEIEKNK